MKVKLFIFIFLIPGLSWAKTFQLKNGSISFDVPASWAEIENLFGVQLMLLGPMKNTKRPVITVESSEVDIKLEASELKKTQENYYAGRKKWLSSRSGEVVEFISYSEQVLKNKLKLHSVGYRYKLGKDSFAETTHYLVCGKNLFNFKVLIPLHEEKQYLAVVDKFLKSLDCPEGNKK